MNQVTVQRGKNTLFDKSKAAIINRMKITNRNLLKRVIPVLTLAVGPMILAGCGGGGNGTPDTTGDNPINIQEQNTPPWANDDAYVLDEGALLEENVVANDTKVQKNGTLTAELLTGPSNATSFSLNQDGSFSYAHDGGESRSDSFTYKVLEGSHESLPATVTLSIEAVNDPPNADAESYSIDQGGELIVNAADGLLVGDSDPEGNPLLARLVNGTKHGALSLNNDGSFSYAHNGSENFTDSFSYEAFDGSTASTSAIVTISIGPVNHAPLAVNDSGITSEDDILSGNVLSNDSDPDSNDALSVTSYDAVSAQGAQVIIDADGNFSYDPTQSVDVQALNADETILDNFHYSISDEGGNVASATANITVSGINDAPLAVSDNFNSSENETLIVSAGTGILANDFDSEQSPLSATLVDDVINGTLSLNADGSFTYIHNGGEASDDSFSYRADDGSASSQITMVTISLTGVNDPPTIAPGCSTTEQENAVTAFLRASDAETPSLLTYQLGANGSEGLGPYTAEKGIVTIIDQTTGEYRYEPFESGARGLDSFPFQVVDPDGGVSDATETVIVHPKVMPLGDSITMGTLTKGNPAPGERIGYRRKLHNDLTLAGYNVDFTGSMQDGSSATPQIPDPDHEGHGGWTAAEIAWGRNGGYPQDGVRAWLDSNPSDIILLHIGTNDPNPSNYVDVENILNEIDAWENSVDGNPVTVILARIVDWQSINPDVNVFNNNVVAMAQNRISNPNNPAYPDDIIIVNMEDMLVYPDNMFDEFHPNETGYDKMADVWLFPLAGLGVKTNTGLTDQTGAYSGDGILAACPQ